MAEEPSPLGIHVARVEDVIGRRLRRHYEELEGQPLPDRFSVLLDALDAQDCKRRQF